MVRDQIAEFHIQVTYNPQEVVGNTFTCVELLSNTTVKTSKSTFPDLPELRYLTVCLGYGLNTSGQPYRYSNIDVIDFSIEKLPRYLALPTMSFSENVITMSCATRGANIYYKTNSDTEYSLYTEPIEIEEDVIIQAYSSLTTHMSEVVVESFQWDDGIEEPVIMCDGEQVEINCETMGADIYYRIGDSGAFSLYSTPFDINTTVVVQAYATIDEKQSETVEETCTYVPIVVSAPTISCLDNVVTIECQTPRSEIHYRTGGEG